MGENIIYPELGIIRLAARQIKPISKNGDIKGITIRFTNGAARDTIPKLYITSGSVVICAESVMMMISFEP